MTLLQLRPPLLGVTLAAALAACAPALAQEPRSEGEPPVSPAPPPAAPEAAQTPPKVEQASAPKAGPEELPGPPRGTRPGDVQRVFVVQHVSSNQLATLLKVFPAEVRAVSSRGLNAVGVSAKPAVLAAIAETIKRLDQPAAGAEGSSSNVELTGYVLEGLGGAQGSEPLPSELQGVVAQLRLTFKYPAYRLLDTVIARVRGDGSKFSVRGVTERKVFHLGPSYYSLSANETTVVGDNPRVVRLTHLYFGLEIPVPAGPPPADNSKPREFQYKTIGLSSNMDIRDGRYVVVGKSGLGDSDDALVVVLTAKVVD